MPRLYMLIGVPASGKSTWIKNQNFGDAIIASSDAYIDQVAAKSGKTYNDVFKDNIDKANQFVQAQVRTAIHNDKDLVWDQTNTSKKSRRGKLAQVPENYEKIAVFFPTPDMLELNRRLASRSGKNIPHHVMNQMIGSLEPPDPDEGFDSIIQA